MSTPTREHPSNKLYHGEVRGFDAACATLRAAIRSETDWLKRHGGLSVEDAAFWDRYRAQVDEAQRQHAAALAVAHAELAAAWRATGEGTFADFAEAIETGDYSRLAF